MINEEIREHIRKLVDNASDTQLDAVLQLLESTCIDAKYSKEDIESFYERIQLFEAEESIGYSVDESHASIRNKYKQHGA